MGKLILNSTQIPNIILDEWMYELTPAEFKVVMVIARQTYGWNKENDWLTYSQLIEKTGLSKETVATALKGLHESGKIIVMTEDGEVLTDKRNSGRRKLFYCLNTGEKSENPTFKSQEIRHTKETNTNISLSKDKHNMAKAYGNEFVTQVLEEFKKISGLERSADKYPQRVAWNFHQKYGASNFGPAMSYLQSVWKKDITKIETVKLHYPTYQKDVLKHSVETHELTDEEKAMERMIHQ